MLVKRIQLGLLHLALAMTLVPINSTINRVMIAELGIAAIVVSILAAVPYLFSPIQVAIGAFSDRHPMFGLRRSPYIFIGMLLCVFGVVTSPYLAVNAFDNVAIGMLISLPAFGAWGMGFNFASVSYFALASEISGPQGRSRTIAVMFTMMILGIIGTSILLSRMLDPYSHEALYQACAIVGGLALVAGMLGLVGLEERVEKGKRAPSEDYTLKQMVQGITANPQATLFFGYLVLLLTTMLGQDILLEPYAAKAFNMSVSETTRLTTIWGISFLISLIITGRLEGRIPKLTISKIGAWGAIAAFASIVMGSVLHSTDVFYAGVILLGLSIGLATVSNLSLMLDMTTPTQVGLFIGAWGMASAIARLIGYMLNGALRDIITYVTGSYIGGYQVVFTLQIVMLLASLVILSKIDLRVFLTRAESAHASVIERAALAGDM